jgi:hypothetical protein
MPLIVIYYQSVSFIHFPINNDFSLGATPPGVTASEPTPRMGGVPQ